MTSNPSNTLFDATRDSYVSLYEAMNQAQSRAIRWSRLWLDEVEASQKESRRVVDELIEKNRQSQSAWLELTRDNFRTVSSFFRWPNVPGFEDLNNRIDELNRRTEKVTTATK